MEQSLSKEQDLTLVDALRPLLKSWRVIALPPVLLAVVASSIFQISSLQAFGAYDIRDPFWALMAFGIGLFVTLGAFFVRTDAKDTALASATRDLTLRTMAVLLALIVMGFLSNDGLPDFLNYRNLYTAASNSTSYNESFMWMVGVTRSLGISYEMFRLTVGFLGGVLLFLLASKAETDSNSLIFFGSFDLLVFMLAFEFYEIRLRGGLSSLLFMLAFLPEFDDDKLRLRLPLRILQIVLCLVGFALHPPTMTSLALFALPPLLYLKYRPNWLRPAWLLFAVGVLAAWGILYYETVVSVPIRGVLSPLNPARFFALSVVPLALFLAFDWQAYRKMPDNENGLTFFPFVFSVTYLLVTLVMTAFFMSGHLDMAGEAVVRVMTLSSFPAAFVIGRWGVGRGRLVPAYLLACNGLFFFNTVYL